MKRILGIVISCIVVIAPAWAQPLADRVPEDAMIYVGWCGAGSLPSGYDHTHLKAVLDNSKLRELFTRLLPDALNLLAAKQPDARGPIEVGSLLAASLWKHPTAFYFAGLDTADPRQPMPKAAILCQAGADAPLVFREINNLLAGVGDVPISSFMVEDFVVVAVGYRDAAQVLAGAGGGKALKESDAFKSAVKHVQSDSVFTVYADTEKLLRLIEAITGENLEVSTRIQTVVDALGVRGIKRVISTCGFDREDWMSQCFVEAPMPRSGLLELMDSAPISTELLKAVPKDATFFATGRLDAAKAIGTIRTAATQIDPQAGKMVDMGLGAVQMALAKNLVTDILEPMGADWAAYCSPSVAGNGIFGIVVVNKLDDPAKAQQALPVASINLSNWATTAMMAAKAPVTVPGRMTKIDGMNVYYVGLPIVAPSWTMKDGYLYLALYPQTAASGARATARNTASGDITTNEKFIALQKRLGVSQPRSLSFYDLQASAAGGSSYQMLQVLLRYAGIADMFGLEVPEPLMPPMDKLLEHLGPAGSATWVDDAGFHGKSVSPFPGSKVFSEPGMISGAMGPGSAMGAAIMLPALNRARDTAKAVQSMNHLRQIGMACMMYSADNQGMLPPNLEAVLPYMENRREILRSPLGHGGDAVDYVYLGSAQLRLNALNEPGGLALAYDGAALRRGQGINVLFVDGHVESVKLDRFHEILDRSRQAGLAAND